MWLWICPQEKRRGPGGNNGRQRQTQFIDDDPDSRSQPPTASGPEAGADSEFERRVSQLAKQAPPRPPRERQQPAEQLDVLALSPDSVQPRPSPATDDATDGKPSWLVQVGIWVHADCRRMPPCTGKG